MLEEHRFHISNFFLAISGAFCLCAAAYAWQLHAQITADRADLITLQQLLNESPIPLGAAEITTGKVIYRNRAMVKLTGETPEEVNARGGIREYYSQDAWNALMETIACGRIYEAQLRLRRKEGYTPPLQVRVVPVPLQDRMTGIFFFSPPALASTP